MLICPLLMLLLDYCNSNFRSLSSFNMCKLQFIQNALARIVTTITNTHGHFLFSNDSIGSKLNFSVSSKLPLCHPSYFGSLLSTLCGRYNIQLQDKGFSEVPQFCPSVHKSEKCFDHSFAFDAPTVWNDLPDDICSAPTLACFRKRLKLYLQKGIPKLAYTLSGISMVLKLATVMDR